ncbi:MAG: phosphoribosyltransferase [Actinobacteria bacterium]|nr:phosphoribosyltransferase [Actinomycetota bacterium]
MRYRDRDDAGRRLAAGLEHLRGARPVVLGLPRGGVVVADVVARALGAALDVAVVRKVGVPGHAELAMGAVGEGGAEVADAAVMASSRVAAGQFREIAERERELVATRAARYRAVRPMVSLAGRTAVVVDDGIATGSTARAALAVVRASGVARVVLAVPVAPASALAALADLVDELRCPLVPSRFVAVGQWYDDFSPVADADVEAILAAAATRDAGGA